MSKKLLDGVTATGAGPLFGLPVPHNHHTVHVEVTGNPTAVTVGLEARLGSLKWVELVEHVFLRSEITNQTAMFHVPYRIVDTVRLNLKTLEGGTSPTVTALYTSLRADD